MRRMPRQFPIYEIVEADFASDKSEPMGTKSKLWVRDHRDRLWLCKLVRVRPETGLAAGEDWAEVITSDLCEMLTIPHAHYEFANWGGMRAVVARCVLREDRDELRVMDEVLELPAASIQERKKRSRVHHTLAVLWNILGDQGLALPPRQAVPPGIETPQDLFIGYLMLDALVGNTDRHEQNLALIYRRNARNVRRFLSPTFDHGSSLGRELTTERRQKMLADDLELEKYRTGCCSKIYTGGDASRQMLTMEAFMTAAKWKPGAGLIWLDRLAAVEADSVNALVSCIPNQLMDATSKQLASTLLSRNSQNLLDMRNLLK